MERIYTPGVCNLSDAEANRRNAAGWFGLVITLLLEAYFLYANIIPIYRIIIFVPATIAAMGFLQAAMHFCVVFGMGGVFNMSNVMGKTETIADATYRAQDRNKAQKLILYSIALGVVAAVLAYIV